MTPLEERYRAAFVIASAVAMLMLVALPSLLIWFR
jgi:hypothetical protein